MPDVHPDAIRDIAPRFQEVQSQLLQAQQAVARTEAVHFGNFTALAVAMATAHVEAENVLQQELISKQEAADEFITRLQQTADGWEQTEDAITTDATVV